MVQKIKSQIAIQFTKVTKAFRCKNSVGKVSFIPKEEKQEEIEKARATIERHAKGLEYLANR